MSKQWIGTACCAVALIVTGVLAVPAHAGITVYEEGDKKIEIGGRIQATYLNVDVDNGPTEDRTFFRRLRPYIQGTVTENWLGKIQFDFGESEDADEVKLKDAYMQYLGLENHKITVGNSKTPFSREFLTSSKRQQLVERSFVGDHNFGSPDRQLGIRIDGSAMEKKLTYAGAVGSESHDPSVERMDFDTPVNNASDWNQGYVVAARVDYHPRGFMKFDQADFRTDEWLFNVSAAAFVWENDDDNNSYTDPATGLTTDTSKVDLDQADGVEVSAGVRGKGFSADVEYQMISGDTVDSTFTGGLYQNGSTDLDKLAAEAGYMLVGNHIEFVAGWDSLDADNYEEQTERTSVGFNWYLNKHKVKLQTTYRMTENSLGVRGLDSNSLWVQAQFVF
jgi:hypothetical protein